MNGFDRLKEQVKDRDDATLKQIVDYLLTREDMEAQYLNEEKSIDDMEKFIRKKAMSHAKNGWTYITNEVVFSWAVMYWSLPNKFLKIDTTTKKTELKKSITNKNKNNVIPFDKEKQELEKKDNTQISLFGGDMQ